MTDAPLRVLLLEQIHSEAEAILRSAGFSVESLGRALDEAELVDRVADVALIGLRSKTRITQRVLDAAPNLVAIGAFCIGTNQ
ncbi:MAG: phosphoglycerate dehydrogenase, partial [Pseudonocardiales bacterium]